MLWPKHVIANLVNVVDGQPLRYVLGRANAQSDFARFKIAAGDTLIALHIDHGRVCPIARMDITFKGTLAQLRETASDLTIEGISHPEFQQIMVGTNGSPQHFFRPLPVETLRLLRYDAAKAPRAVKVDDDGKLASHLGLDGVFRLTPESADELATIPWI